MRVSLEWFLLDNMAVNLLLLHLAGALGGMEMKPGRAVLVSLLGAVWDALALGRFPRLLSLPGRVACLLATAFLVGRREYLRAVLSLLVASVILGGALLLLTGGTLLGALPLRVGVYSLCLLPLLIRGMRYLVRRGFEGACVRRVRLEAGGSVRELTAFLDTGNLLTEPLSGLPVVLVGAEVPLPPGRPLLVEGRGAVEVSRGRVWPAAGGEAVPVYVGRAPMDLGEYEALLPGAAVHEGRKRNVQKAARAVLSALCPAVLQAVSVLSGAERGEPAPAAVAGGGEKLCPGGPNQRGGPEQAHRAQPQVGGVHRPEV